MISRVDAQAHIKSYLLAGTGARGLSMFGKSLINDFSKTARLVGLFDSNIKRLHAANEILNVSLPVYTDFGEAIAALDPDTVIIATRDSTHAPLIVQALKAGKDVICEKPLCVDAGQCEDIYRARGEHGGKVCVTHNCRYIPAMALIKQLVSGGAIGRILYVQFNEKLDRQHGSDYFRRWHRRKENSGGLIIHKSSHHFDLINWFIGSEPVKVFASGSLSLYGPNGPIRGTRCRGCEHATTCQFYVDMFCENDPRSFHKLYLEAESEDGYFRDGCVFDPEIDIEDVATVTYHYQSGTEVQYSLVAFAGYEGMDVVLEGEKGRIEYRVLYDPGWAVGRSGVHGLKEQAVEALTLYPAGGRVQVLDIPKAEGEEHLGADPKIREDIFVGVLPEDHGSRVATLEEGIRAVLVGDAANKSIATNRPIEIGFPLFRNAKRGNLSVD